MAVNINYVHGPSFERSQTWMPPIAWVATLMTALPLILYLPSHWVLGWLFPGPPALQPVVVVE